MILKKRGFPTSFFFISISEVEPPIIICYTKYNMKKPEFVSDPNCIYHIYNRGVEKRKVFLDDKDYFRFIHDLFEFNDIVPAGKFSIAKSTIGGSTSDDRKKRVLIVEILAFCLMPNHFHLLIRQLAEGGIVKFMQKLGTGYTMYFNEKNERVGGLFQGRFKAVLVDKENHFLYLPYYIHSNPLDLIIPKWKEEGIKDWRRASQFLASYRWSSYLDYIGKKNFPSVISTKFLNESWGEPKEYKSAMKEWLKSLDVEEIRDLILE